MKLPSLLFVAAPALLAGTSAAQSFLEIPGGAYTAADITPDGEIVVGAGSGGAYLWRWKVDPTPTYLGAQEAVAVSDDGTVIAGNMQDPVTGQGVAARWTAATGWVPLGGLTGSCGSITTAYDMSGDGSRIVGLGWTGCSGQGFLWTEGLGMQELEWLGNQKNRASAISADGTVAVGFAQGNFNRTPARWTTADALGEVPDMDDVGEYHGVSRDGSVLLGGRARDAYFDEWDEAAGTYVPTNLGGMNVTYIEITDTWAEWTSRAVAVSDSGGTIAGYDSLQGATEAWVWNPQSGIVRLQDRLTTLGVPNVPYLGVPQALTPDGKIVVGLTQFQGAWIAEIPPGPIVKPYGCDALNPAESLVLLAGSPSLATTFTLGVDDPTDSVVGPAFGIVAFSTASDPSLPCGTPLPGFGMAGPAGGLLVSIAGGNPFLQLMSPNLWTTSAQPVDVDFSVPFDLSLMGFDLYAQGALFSPSTFKIALTNGLVITLGLN